MNKFKLLLALIVLTVGVFIASLFFSNNKNNDKKNQINIPDYSSDLFCKYSEEASDEESETYTSNVYISYNKGGDITRIVYQTVMLDDFGTSTVDNIKDFYKMYEDLDGIEIEVERVENYVISTIKYDYTKLNLKQVRNELKDVLDVDSFLNKGKLPINYNDYIETYLDEYLCEVR